MKECYAGVYSVIDEFEVYQQFRIFASNEEQVNILGLHVVRQTSPKSRGAHNQVTKSATDKLCVSSLCGVFTTSKLQNAQYDLVWQSLKT